MKTRYLPLGILLLSMISVPLLIFQEEGLPRYRLLKAEHQRLQHDNSVLEHRVRQLRRRVHALKTDDQVIEQIARDQLGLVRQDEIVFQF